MISCSYTRPSSAQIAIASTININLSHKSKFVLLKFFYHILIVNVLKFLGLKGWEFIPNVLKLNSIRST